MRDCLNLVSQAMLDCLCSTKSSRAWLGSMYGLAPTVKLLLDAGNRLHLCIRPSWQARAPAGQNWLSSRSAHYREASRAGRAVGFGSRRSDLCPIFQAAVWAACARWRETRFSISLLVQLIRVDRSTHIIVLDRPLSGSSAPRQYAGCGWPIG